MTDGGTTWAKHGRRLLRLEEAWEVIAREARPLGKERVSLADADGRVLAGPVAANNDHPAFDKAMMDGFAVRAADCTAPGARLKVTGLVSAGGAAASPIAPGTSMKINTGAPIPAGADAVVRIEDTESAADGVSVVIKTAIHGGLNISRRGDHRKKGNVVLCPPLRLRAAHLAAAASAGASTLDVSLPVGAAVVATGDELAPPGAPLRAGQIHESNGVMLAALCRQFGATPNDMGIARDEPGELASRFAEALKQPVMMAAGGMSMGTLDLVPQALEALGVRWLFHGVEIRPGKPVAYGRGPAGQHVFGLPGNPVSAFVCAWLFVRAAIEGLLGFPVGPPKRWRVALSRDLKPSKDPRPAFIPARVWHDEKQGMLAEPCHWAGSGDPFGLAAANALLALNCPTQACKAGSAADVIMLEAF